MIAAATKAHLANHRSLVSRLVWKRARFENWLQLCLLNELQSELPSLDIERAYPNSSERCDFWLPAETSESWLELKLCVTNYCSTFADFHRARPITNQISDILRDVRKLQRLQSAERSVFVLAYPLPESYETHSSWQGHLKRIQDADCSVDEAFALALSRNDVNCKIVGYTISIVA